MADTSKRKLTVTSFKPVTSGTGPKGNAWTLYEVFAVGEDGQPIQQKLKSFADPAPQLNQLVEYDVERQDHEKYGVSFLISPPKKAGASLGPKVDELRGRIEQLERRVDLLERNPNGTQPATTVPPTAPPAPAPAPAPVPAAAANDDIPF